MIHEEPDTLAATCPYCGGYPEHRITCAAWMPEAEGAVHDEDGSPLWEECSCKGAGYCLKCFDFGYVPHTHEGAS